MEIITTHKNTDFDALASVIAATILFPDAVPVLPKSLNPNVKAFLSIHKDLFEIQTPGQIDYSKVKKLIVVDTSRWSRLEKMKQLQRRDDLEIIIWDHHPDPGDMNASWKCHEQIGANITLMFRDLKPRDLALSPIQATLFLM